MLATQPPSPRPRPPRRNLLTDREIHLARRRSARAMRSSKTPPIPRRCRRKILAICDHPCAACGHAANGVRSYIIIA